MQVDNERPQPTKWLHPRYHTRTYIKSYDCDIPSISGYGVSLEVDSNVAPPDFCVPAGRPTKKRRDRSYLKKTDRQVTCRACGETGHFAKSCKKPSTEYRYNLHLAGALNWIEKKDKENMQFED